ncbi:TetR/AcrR family transcriptional regulator [Sneathiella litorea]|uniref:TetR family transcriptional regulator n=1 Tax=Sneathiella litorea TaxID=2606216 RepID=A0A6L8W7B6_9PROT|nr:TetR/AcrR family transcriptional regulator [Sneathiella litorea]MZR30422.1 TetR family transcriptional regulator [Sneathiella litorea]
MAREMKAAGRPRDPKTAENIKSTTLRLMREQGYAAVSIASIISESGVAKQTIYNRWKTKADLVLDAIFEETERYASAPDHDFNKSCREQLYQFLIEVFEHLERDSRIICALIASAQEDKLFQKSFRERFVNPREKIVEDILRRAHSLGQISTERDIPTLVAFIHGAFWYPLLNGIQPDRKLAQNIVAEIFRH